MLQIITIGREFGSGGREIGLKVAQALKIPFYDKEMISLVSEKGQLDQEILRSYEETVVHAGVYFPRPTLFASYTQPLTDQIFFEQRQVIINLAEQGSCVIVGRCADYVLGKKAVNVFVHADMQSRIQRKLLLNIGVLEKDMEKHICSVDKKRKAYYKHYTDMAWGMSQNYDLCINTSRIGIEGSAEMILHHLMCNKEVQ